MDGLHTGKQGYFMRNKLQGLGQHIDPSEMPTDRLAEIAEIVGSESAIRLCEEFAGIPITFGRKDVIALKREFVRRCGSGMSPRDLARKLDIGERQVFKWYAEPIQGNLFEDG